MNINIKETVIDDGFGVFSNITTEIFNHANNTQYFVPGLTFIFVLYTYFTVGEGKVWKYLLGTTFSGFIASTLTSIYDIIRMYFTLDYVLQIKWFENIFWHLNEYGFVYITFMKLKIVVEELQKSYWNYIMNILFVYNLIVRLIIAAANIMGRSSKACSHLQILTFLPLALVEFIFMCLIVKTFIKESYKMDISKGIVSTMLNSTLTRMFLVGLIYLLASLVCFFYHPPFIKSIKNLVWRAKSCLGLIFLLDLLFIRIDLKNKITTPHELNSYFSKNTENSFTLRNFSNHENTVLNSSSINNENSLQNSYSVYSPTSLLDNNYLNNRYSYSNRHAVSNIKTFNYY